PCPHRGDARPRWTAGRAPPDRPRERCRNRAGAPGARPLPCLGARAYRRFLHRFPGAALRLVRAARRAEPEMVAAHCTKFHAPYVLALRLALRAPIVVHLHNGPETADGPESPRLQRLLQRCATRVIAVSPAVADYARAVLPRRAEGVVTVPNGTDAEEFADAPPAPPTRPYVRSEERR